MTELEFLSNHIFFTTREYATFLDKNLQSTSRKLHQKELDGDLIQVTRGIWANKFHRDFSPYAAIPYLLNNEQGYLSFLSALHRHDVISQIPMTIQIATTGRTRVLKSPIGEFQFFQMRPEFMREGVEVYEGNQLYNMATSEKALLDTFYIATKTRRFRKLPELDLTQINQKKLAKLLEQYPKVSQNLIRKRLDSQSN